MKNITRLVILFRIHKIHQLKKYLKIDLYLFTFTWIRGSGRPSKVPLNSCYTGEFAQLLNLLKLKLSQVTQIKTQTVVVVDQQESDEDKDEDAVNSPVINLKKEAGLQVVRKRKEFNFI